MPYHKPFTVDNRHYDLAHLDPITLSVQSEKLGRLVTVWCWFTTHTFSRRCLSSETAPDFLDEGRRPRMFCPARYGLSFHLPAVVRQLADPRRYVWQTAAERNWFYRAQVRVAAGDEVADYEVFFAVKKADKAVQHDVELVVESAYALDPLRLPKLRGRMLFAGLLTATVQGRPVHTRGGRRK